MRLAWLYKAIVANKKKQTLLRSSGSRFQEVAVGATANPTASLGSSTTRSLQGGWQRTSVTQLHLVFGEANHSSKPTLPVYIQRHPFSVFTGRKSFAERAGCGGAEMGTGVRLWMSTAKITAAPIWQTQTDCVSLLRSLLCGTGVLLQPMNSWILVKYSQGEQTKVAHTRNVSIWACSVC